jgi:phospholipase A-2-activating protein
LKLPFNVNQNPYDAATKFLENNKLPMTYLEAVAAHIVANTQGVTLGESQDTTSGPGSDPWGSDQRYRPGGESAPAAPRPQPKTLPHKDYLSIMVSQFPKLQKKVQEVNQGFIANKEKDTTLILTPTELTTLDNLRKAIESKSSQSVPGALDLILKLATAWPYNARMPGLDALRLLAATKETALYTDGRGHNIIDAIIHGATETQPAAENHQMMGVRAFANLFETKEGRELAKAEFTKVQGLTKSAIAESTNRNLLVAAATLYINYAVFFLSNPSEVAVEAISETTDTLTTILKTQSDSEVIFRALVATGTLLMVEESVKDLLTSQFDVEGALSKASSKVNEPRIRNLVAEIRTFIR